MIKPKLTFRSRTDGELLAFTDLVCNQMGEHAETFPAPNPTLTELSTQRQRVASKIAARAALLQQVQAMTIEIRDGIVVLGDLLTREAAYVADLAKGDASIIMRAGFEATGERSPVGPMPKVEGLSASQGENVGEVDLHWNPIRRGVHIYEIELTEAANGADGWRLHCTERTSRCTIRGLTPGKRYWFRVRAVGSEGPGMPSDAVTRTAPVEA